MNILNPPDSVGIFLETNINGDSCDVFNNIFLDPQFYSTTGDSAFYLTEASPCIDAGDPHNPLDPDSTIADIGAYYYHQSGLIPPVIDDLTISIAGNNVTLQWSPFTIPIVYNIYRPTEPYFDPIGMTPIATTFEPEYTDVGIASEGAYFYVVTTELVILNVEY